MSARATLEWPPPDMKEDVPLTYPALFLKNASQTPPFVPAVLTSTNPGGAVTYGSLMWHVCQLALTLRKQHGVQNGKSVVILMEKSNHYIIAILAILLAGGSYVPLSPRDPKTLLDRVVSGINPALAFCDPDLSLEGVENMVLSGEIQPHTAPSAELYEEIHEMVHAIKPEEVACTVFSSGTTGNPKGIAIPHMAKASSYTWRFTITKPKRCGGSRIAANIFFVWEALRPFLLGATLVVIPDDVIFDPPRLLDALRSNSVTEWLSTPSLFESVLQLSPYGELQKALRSLRALLFNGEVLRKDLARRALDAVRSPANPKGRVFNLYSISECHEVSIFEVTHEKLDAMGDSDTTPVGVPMPYAKVYLLDPETKKQVEEGSVGLLHIGGPGLAVGYVGNKVLTAERFPVIEGFGRLYNTGDLASFEKGMIKVMGRGDSMVKIRGYSVVLGSVEAALKRTLGLDQCCVIAEGKEGEDKRLVAYVVFSFAQSWKIDPETGICTDAFAALRHALPLSNIPSCFVSVDAVPVHPVSGKANVKALPPPPPRSIGRSDMALMGGELSVLALRALIAEELSLPVSAVGPNDDFFALGGHSLLAARLAARIQKCDWTNEKIHVAAIFQYSSPASLFKLLSKSSKVPVSDVAIEHVEIDFLSDIEKWKGELDQHFAGSSSPVKTAVPLTELKEGVLLVTGSTGYLGDRVIKTLQNTPLNVTIVRLVRAGKANGPLFGESRSAICFVEGDLNLPNLGLKEDVYEKLKKETVAIVHCAAWVNLLASYSTLRSANVGGTFELLKLGKQMCYVSTSDADEKATNGYGQSKYVSEMLVRHVQEKEYLPTVIIRPADIAGGSGNPKDHRYLVLKTLVESGGVAPPVKGWKWRAFLIDDLLNCIINSSSDLPPPHVVPISTVFQWMREEGYTITFSKPIEGEGEEEFFKRFIEHLPPDSPLVPLHQTGALLPLFKAHDPHEQPEEKTIPYSRDLFKKELFGLRLEGVFPDPLPLVSHVAIVTGASSGIGAAISRRLMMAGARVVMLSRRGTSPEFVTEGFQEGKHYKCLVCDVREAKSVKRAFSSCRKYFGSPSVVVNNAGVMYFTLMENLKKDQWERTVDTICTGTINVLHSALPHLLSRKDGTGSGAHIINITSDAGKKAFAGLAVYSGAKFFVEALSTAMREEFVAHEDTKHIRVSNVQPGNVQTNLLKISTDPDGLSEYGAPSGEKVLEPDDVARAVIYILSQPGHCAINELLVEPRMEPI